MNNYYKILVALFFVLPMYAMESGKELQLKSEDESKSLNEILDLIYLGSLEEMKKLEESGYDFYKPIDIWGSFFNCAVECVKPEIVQWLVDKTDAQQNLLEVKNDFDEDALMIIQDEIGKLNSGNNLYASETLPKALKIRDEILTPYYNSKKKKS